MRPEFLGDSYDLVKRFFCETLRSLGYSVFIDPLFTGTWSGQEKTFYRFLGVETLKGVLPIVAPAALFLDPDTGLNEKRSQRHVSFNRLVTEIKKYSLVFVFDQSISRNRDKRSILEEKLEDLGKLGCPAFYYSSHANFVFASNEAERLQRLQEKLLSLGLPGFRLISNF